MAHSIDKKTIEDSLKVSDTKIYQEDKIWSRYSNDKVDIGEELTKVIRTLHKALPLSKPLRALSIGSSAEPQFRILETAFRGGLYLLDIEEEPLDIVKERIRRQYTDHVTAIRGDYDRIFLSTQRTKGFLKTKLDKKKVDLVTLHHSLYYCEEELWHLLFDNIYRVILAPKGAIHAVLMTAESNNPYTTTWLYNHFVGRFFGYRNNQDLYGFKKELKDMPIFRKTQIISKTNRVRFYVDDFKKFMAVIWMILLYPSVHKYSLRQKEEITEFIYKRFWQRKIPLLQMQDHLIIYRGIRFKGII